jgi:hypothetical protein
MLKGKKLIVQLIIQTFLFMVRYRNILLLLNFTTRSSVTTDSSLGKALEEFARARWTWIMTDVLNL